MGRYRSNGFLWGQRVGLFSFTQEQIRGIRRIPADRLLLETDSPHLRVGLHELNPGQIGVTYGHVAEIRQVDLQQLVAQVRTNFNLLFGHQLRRAPLPGVY